nr:DNA methyltransferase [Roseomonas aerilata]
MCRPIENNSSPGQAVYEPFSGSGTTLIAAEMSGRACHAVELSPAYSDVAVLRWQAFTGQEARLEGSRATFAEVEPSAAPPPLGSAPDMPQGSPYLPTEEQRRTVRVMAGFGIPQPDIATLLEIDPKTLRLHFRRELDCGSVEATVKVAQTLFQMATSGQNTAASIFWMKARAGWREKHEVVLSAKPAGEMTDAELEEEIARARAARLVLDREGPPNED